MDKRIVLVSPNGGTEVEVYESDAAYMISQGWKPKSETKAKAAKEAKLAKEAALAAATKEEREE